MAASPVDGPAFLHLVTHDLRAPVAAVRTMVSLLAQGHLGELPPPQADLVGRIDRRLESLQALLDDLIDLAAVTACPPAAGEADLCAVSRETCSRLEARGRPGCSPVQVQAPHERVLAAILPADLELAVTHLVSNAMKYGRGRPIVVRVERVADAAHLVVSDEGIGITAAARARLFEPMFRAPEAAAVAAGSGLGLLIVKEAVARCGGEVTIDSTAGAGTSVTLRLPLVGAGHEGPISASASGACG